MLKAFLIAALVVTPGALHLEPDDSGTCEGVARPAFEAALTGHLCQGSDTEWYFTETRQASSAYPRCWKEIADVISTCAASDPEDAADLAPPPPVDPDFDEHSPTGPGEGPPGAVTVDKTP